MPLYNNKALEQFDYFKIVIVGTTKELIIDYRSLKKTTFFINLFSTVSLLWSSPRLQQIYEAHSLSYYVPTKVVQSVQINVFVIWYKLYTSLNV